MALCWPLYSIQNMLFCSKIFLVRDKQSSVGNSKYYMWKVTPFIACKTVTKSTWSFEEIFLVFLSTTRWFHSMVLNSSRSNSNSPSFTRCVCVCVYGFGCCKYSMTTLRYEGDVIRGYFMLSVDTFFLLLFVPFHFFFYFLFFQLTHPFTMIGG